MDVKVIYSMSKVRYRSSLIFPPSQVIGHFKNLRESKHLKFDQIYMIKNNIYDIN